MIVILPFLQQDPKFLCNEGGKWLPCLDIEAACRQNPVTIDEINSPDSITRKFGLYCGDSWKKGLLGTTLFATAAVSTLVVSIISNNYGRKIAITTCFTFGGLGMILIGFSPNYITALILF